MVGVSDPVCQGALTCRYFELELFHARWAMLSALGILVPGKPLHRSRLFERAVSQASYDFKDRLKCIGAAEISSIHALLLHETAEEHYMQRSCSTLAFQISVNRDGSLLATPSCKAKTSITSASPDFELRATRALLSLLSARQAHSCESHHTNPQEGGKFPAV